MKAVSLSAGTIRSIPTDTPASLRLTLASYSEERLDRCQFGNGKPTCRKCPVHCYKPDMREMIREVMRFSGPRMIFRHPIAAIRHLAR